MKRQKTDYPGVFYRLAPRLGGNGKEKVFYVDYRRGGIRYEEKAGRQFADNMTEAKANIIRSGLIEGRRIPKAIQRKEVVPQKWTISKLWTKYKEYHEGGKSLIQDESRYNLYIEPEFGKKEPSQLEPDDVKQIEKKLLKTKSAGSVKNVLELLRRLINYGNKMKYCTPASFQIEMPAVDNIKTEEISPDQMKKLLRILKNGIVISDDGIETILDVDARQAMFLALLTGMRRGEIFRLMWDDVNFEKGFITIREPKGGKSQTIPLSESAKTLLEARNKKTMFVFPGKKTSHRIDMAKHFRKIREAAGLSPDFRPMHGLRHAFASNLASSGKVNIYTIQKLLTHKSPMMTQRYAHLTDDVLRNAANLAGNILDTPDAKPNVVQLKKSGGKK